MATTLTHRAHVHIPLTTLIAFLVTVVLAIVVILAIQAIRPATQEVTTTQGLPVIVPAATVPMPESPALRRAVQAGEVTAPVMAPVVSTYARNHVQGTTLDPVVQAETPTGTGTVPVDNPHPFNVRP